MNARTQTSAESSPRTASGLACLAIAMGGAGLSGAIIGGAADVAQNPLMPTWANPGGTGALAAGLLVAAVSAAIGWVGYRWWRGDHAAG